MDKQLATFNTKDPLIAGLIDIAQNDPSRHAFASNMRELYNNLTPAEKVATGEILIDKFSTAMCSLNEASTLVEDVGTELTDIEARYNAERAKRIAAEETCKRLAECDPAKIQLLHQTFADIDALKTNSVKGNDLIKANIISKYKLKKDNNKPIEPNKRYQILK